MSRERDILMNQLYQKTQKTQGDRLNDLKAARAYGSSPQNRNSKWK